MIFTSKFKQHSEKVCPECGEKMNEHTGSYIMECDRCLANRTE